MCNISQCVVSNNISSRAGRGQFFFRQIKQEGKKEKEEEERGNCEGETNVLRRTVERCASLEIF